LAYAMLILLLIAELGAFVRVNFTTNILMDSNKDETVQIHFDILMFDLPCQFLKVAVWDKFGAEKINTTDAFKFSRVDAQGSVHGSAYTAAEIALLEQADEQGDISDSEKQDLEADWSSSSDSFKHTDFQMAVRYHPYTLVNFYAEWCSHCRQFHPVWTQAAERISQKVNFKDAEGEQNTVKFLKMNCVDFKETCQQVQIQAFPTLRLYKRDGTFDVFQQKRTVENIQDWLTQTIRNSHLIVAKHHSIFNEGCRVQGNLEVARVPGHFHLQAEPYSSVNLNPALTNVSHHVYHLSFGKKDSLSWAQRQNMPVDMVDQLNPLDGKKFIVERFHEAPQHYLKVVSTHLEGKNQVFYQMTHADRVRKLKKDGAGVEQIPQARFTYDFSPMSVAVKAKSKPWYEFLTSLFAILGGTYTVVELCSGAVDTVHHTVKEALGKDN